MKIKNASRSKDANLCKSKEESYKMIKSRDNINEIPHAVR